ncbi:hypothetical protein A3F66_03100 [candidate division TM6 bacterium RIFCSPHIGHO2_12_FULL_32_22]|nr:MAG: hypothetical protein A3F66_03100 [candidate division TM6 bacterium RIFCSPHIGHO2_12_FULL_32_22]
MSNINFLYLLLVVPFGLYSRPGNKSMMPRTNPFKAKHSPTVRLKFTKDQPKVSEKDDSILEGYTATNKSVKKFENLTLEELKAKKIDHANSNNKEIAIKYVEKMMIVSSDQTEIKQLRLELANLHFDLEDYEKSAKAYNDYVSYYPSDKYTEFALFREALSLDLKKNDPERDQFITREAIAKCKQFIKNEHYVTYKKGIIDILRDCYTNLLENELYILNFYLNIKHNVRSAEKRLEYIKSEILPYLKKDAQERVDKIEEELNAHREGRAKEYYKQRLDAAKSKKRERLNRKPKVFTKSNEKSFRDRF